MLARLRLGSRPSTLTKGRAAYASEKGDLRHARDGRLPDEIPFAADSFDLVCRASTCIEHIDDDRDRPGGRMADRLQARAAGCAHHGAGLRLPLEPARREPPSQAALRQGGSWSRSPARPDWTPVCVTTYYNSLLFPLIAGVRLCKKLLRIGDGDDEAMPPWPLNRLLAAVFACERHLIGRLPLPAGVSLLMLARRPES